MNDATKSATRMVGDPFANEKDWHEALSDADALSKIKLEDVSWSTVQPVSRTIQVLASLLVSSVIGVTGTLCVSLSFDWGYELVQSMCGDLFGLAQGILAIFFLWLIVLPLFFGYALGTFKSLYRGTKRWLLAATIPAFGMLCLSIFEGTSLMYSDNLGSGAALFAMSVVMALCGIAAGQRMFAMLKPRVRIRPILVCAALSVAVIGITSLFAPENPILVFAVYSFFMLSAGALAAKFGRARNAIGAFLIAQMAILPIVLTNAINILMNAVSLILDQWQIGLGLGWNALVSAILIAVVTTVASTSGALVGLKIRR